jgi:hypothetical protein
MAVCSYHINKRHTHSIRSITSKLQATVVMTQQFRCTAKAQAFADMSGKTFGVARVWHVTARLPHKAEDKLR